MNNLSLVLLVDDDDISNFITKKQLGNLKVIKELIIKLNGKQAADYLDTCTEKFPDLVLLDINMPIMNGFELLDYYESTSYSGKTKFAILSTSTHKKDKDAALNYKDVIGYIEKPLTTEKMEDLFNSMSE